MEEDSEDRIPQGRKKEDEQRKEKRKAEQESGGGGGNHGPGDDEEDEEVRAAAEQSSGAFYSILNVSSDAPDEEIRAAYRRLSLIFHPDKHSHTTGTGTGTPAANDPQGSNSVNEAAAESESESESADVGRGAVEQFQRITRAYEVLSDPTQRAIYDLYGEEGLKSKMQVGSVLTTPGEIKEEFERIQREKEEARLRAQLHPKGTVTAALDATSLFNPYPVAASRKSSSPSQRRSRGDAGSVGRASDNAEDNTLLGAGRVGLAQLLDFAPDIKQVSLHQSIEASGFFDLTLLSCLKREKERG